MQKIWLKSYPSEVPHEINPDRFSSVTELFEECVLKHRERDAFVNMGTAITFEDLNYLSADFASFFQNTAGLKKGDRVAIQMPNLLQYPIVLWGALRAGLVVVNVNPLYTAREMKHQLNDAGAKAIVILANSAHSLESILKETQVETVVVTEVGDMLGFPKSLLINGIVKYIKKMVPKYNLPKAYSFMEALDLGAEKSFRPEKSQSSDIAFLQYTGGTTGVSKGGNAHSPQYDRQYAPGSRVDAPQAYGRRRSRDSCAAALSYIFSHRERDVHHVHRRHQLNDHQSPRYSWLH